MRMKDICEALSAGEQCATPENPAITSSMAHNTNIIDVLCPPEPSPTWPETRSYEDVATLHVAHSAEVKSDHTRNKRDFASELDDGAVVIDIGAGKGRFITDLRHKAQEQGINIHIVAVGATCLDAEYAKNATYVYYQKVPDHTNLLQQYASSADVVIDTFGAATYADNPMLALLYSLMLLKPGGRYSAISSLVPGYETESAFGDMETQYQLINWCGVELNVHLSITPTFLPSKVKGQEHRRVQDLLICAQRSQSCTQDYSLTRYRTLSRKMVKHFGEPTVLGVWNDADFGKFQIRRLAY